MKYNHYDIQDFLIDKDFISWVKQKGDERAFFFEKWLESDPANKEKALQARELLVSLKPEVLEASQSEFDEVLNQLMKFRKITGDYHLASPVNLWYRWAAIILLVFTTTYLLNLWFQKPEAIPEPEKISYIIKENPAGQRSQIQLPDGSLVHLNAASKLSYPEKFGHDQREIELHGEAFFEVSHNDSIPFVVRTGNIYTRVLGTNFNIEANNPDQSVAVSLLKGQVEVGHAENESWQKARMIPGEKVIFSNQELQTTTFEYGDIAWKEGVIVFEKASLDEIISTLEKWYGVEIKVLNKSARSIRYTNKFERMSLELLLERMSFTENFDYEIMNDLITLKFKPM